METQPMPVELAMKISQLQSALAGLLNLPDVPSWSIAGFMVPAWSMHTRDLVYDCLFEGLALAADRNYPRSVVTGFVATAAGTVRQLYSTQDLFAGDQWADQVFDAALQGAVFGVSCRGAA